MKKNPFDFFQQQEKTDKIKNIVDEGFEEEDKAMTTGELDDVMQSTFEAARKQAVLRRNVYSRLYSAVPPAELVLDNDDSKESRDKRIKVSDYIGGILSEMTIEREKEQELHTEILDGVISYGPIAEFIFDPDVTEVMVNKKDQIFVEKRGKIELTNRVFLSTAHLMQVIQQIVGSLGRVINEKYPMADARLPDGSRVNVIIPPLSVQGPMLTIRKFVTEIISARDLIKINSISEEMARFFQIAVVSRRNIMVSGGTGAGKTTLLNVLSSFIPQNERIITIEDAAELKLAQFHIGRLETRPPDINNEGEIGIGDLFRNSLRMRPDRIIVGECRGAEALDMLQAMNSGHDGSLTTAHANSPKDLLSRLETMCSMAGTVLSISAIRRQIAAAIHLIIHVSRFPDGTRKVSQITEITGMEGETVTRSDIFRFRQTGKDSTGMVIGVFEPTGIVPKFFEDIRELGFKLPMDIF